MLQSTIKQLEIVRMNYFITQFTNLLTYLAHKMTDKFFAFSNQIALLAGYLEV